MHVTINAIPTKPGGVLTILLGLVRSLRIADPSIELTVLTSHEATFDAVKSVGSADRVVQMFSSQPPSVSFASQCFRLGKVLRDTNSDILLNFNHYLPRVSCRQVVYHTNLRRFSRKFRSARLKDLLLEGFRDWSARRALFYASNVFESKFLRDVAEESIGRRARNSKIIYIGLPDEMVTRAQSIQSQSSTSRRLVAITNPQPHKDNSTLIRTLAELTHREPEFDWRLHIAGGIQQRDWKPCKDMAGDLNLRDRITWHGLCNTQQLTALLQDALCLVATSQLESFAMVPIEAMARGCPPVVANCAAMPESIGDAGMLAQPGSPRSFAESVLTLAHDRGLRERLVRKGKKWIRGFRWSTCGEQFCDLFQQLCQKHNSRTTHFRRVA